MSLGFLEGIIRGFKAGLLTQNIYQNLTQCDTLDDFKMQICELFILLPPLFLVFCPNTDLHYLCLVLRICYSCD